jgi:hypothetical protein
MVTTQISSRIWQRYELKYLVSERQAAEAARISRDHMPPDPHSQLIPGMPYPVHSIYLDSTGCDLLRHTIDKLPNRYKLRVRTYRDHSQPQDAQPMFFEVKQRLDGVVRKTRAQLDASVGRPLLWCDQPEPDLFALDDTTRTSLETFITRRRQLGARPLVGVCYHREAFEAPTADRVRVTLDRNLCFGLLSPDGDSRGEIWTPVDPGGVILEIKFTGSYPAWVMHMLHRLDLLRRGVCKYVLCCRASGLRTVGDTGARAQRWTG